MGTNMPLTELVFLGATSFREISEIVRDINKESPRYRMRAILDDNPVIHGNAIESVPIEGPLEMCCEYADAEFVFGIASHRNRMVRADILQRLALPRERFTTLIHPAAKVYSTATIGRGCILFPGAVISCDSIVEDFVQILVNSDIGAANIVCEGALVTSLVATTAEVVLGHFCHIGAGSTIAPRIVVGAGAQVGVGTVVLRDVPAGGFVLGNPGTLLRQDPVSARITAMWQTRMKPRR
jgi:acetyltransferase-like isoleucine patch superfamily enzyme